MNQAERLRACVELILRADPHDPGMSLAQKERVLIEGITRLRLQDAFARQIAMPYRNHRGGLRIEWLSATCPEWDTWVDV